MAKKLASMDEAYANVRVARIDSRLEEIKAEAAELTEKRKLYAPHMTKRTAKKD